MEKDDTILSFSGRMEAWVQKDWWVILIAIMCLGACLYTLNSVGKYQDQINQAWIAQWEESGCAKLYAKPSYNFSWGGNYEIEDRNQDTGGPSPSNGH